jgi:hypothetical protein
MHMTTHIRTQHQASFWGNLATLVVVLCITAIALWGTWQLVLLTPSMYKNSMNGIKSYFASTPLSTTSEQKMVLITEPTEVKTGEATKIMWTDAKRSTGVYAFAYQCRTNISLEVLANKTYRTLACDSVYNIPSTDTALTVRVFSTGKETESIPVGIAYVQDGTKISEAIASITIIPTTHKKTVVVDSAPADEVLPTTVVVAPVATAPQIVHAASRANLVARAAHTYTDGYNGTIVFTVTNMGGTKTGAWYFTADLPTVPAYTYTSGMQKGLKAHETATLTIQFDQMTGGYGEAVITVDPTRSLSETTTTDNTLVVQVQ